MPAAGAAPARPNGGGPATLGYLGALDVVKGVGALLEALPELTASGVRVRIAGDGRLREAVAEAAGRLADVEYLGVVSGADKAAFLGSCDAGLAPSVWDEPGAPPYAAVEWLAAGRPVIAANRGGLAEAAPDFPGLVLTEPTRAGIVEAVRRLRDGGWDDAVERASTPVGSPGDDERWLEDHLRVYDTARGRP